MRPRSHPWNQVVQLRDRQSALDPRRSAPSPRPGRAPWRRRSCRRRRRACLLRPCLDDAGEIIRRAAGRKDLRPLRPAVEVARRSIRCRSPPRALQAQIDERRGDVGDRRVVVGIGIDDGDLVLAREGRRIRERGTRRSAPRRHGVSGRPSCSFGRSARKAPKSSASNCLNGANCQSSGPSFGAELARRRDLKNQSIASPASASILLVDDGAMALHREDETVGRLVAPLGEARRRLGAVEGAVDLDRGELRAGIFRARRRASGPSDRRSRATARRSTRRCRPGSSPHLPLTARRSPPRRIRPPCYSAPPHHFPV